jgi:putative endonuclease
LSRESHIATGEKGEDRAARYLLSQACAIIARNWHAHPGEIDIVARCPYEAGGDVLAFVEVRTRHGRQGLAEESISPRKAASMAAAAYAYMAAHKLDPERTHWRIDLVTVALGSSSVTINWAKGAIEQI